MGKQGMWYHVVGRRHVVGSLSGRLYFIEHILRISTYICIADNEYPLFESAYRCCLFSCKQSIE